MTFSGVDETERTEDGQPLSSHDACPALIVAIEGARPSAGSTRCDLAETREVVVGRGDGPGVEKLVRGSCVTLQIPDRRLSSKHARILREGRRWWLEDCQSTNGTRLNGEAVSRTRILPDDVIELGHTLLLITQPGFPLRKSEADGHSLEGLATLEPELQRRLVRLERVAASTVPIMVRGETGTGKDVVARAVHGRSGRPGKFVAVNCGAIPDNLVESQFFGHKKGAFSGAVQNELGFVRAADMGTLFLDEIGDLRPSAQAALLRVLQESEVVPLGHASPISVDIRVVSATHRPLELLVEQGTFRRDLYARLAGFVHVMPPLRERRADIGLLVAELLASGGLPEGQALRFRPNAARALLRYDWPLNVRELVQCLNSSAVQAREGLITLDDLPPAVASAASSANRTEARDHELRNELERRLTEFEGNVSDVARSMGKARQQVQRWLKRFQLDPQRYRNE